MTLNDMRLMIAVSILFLVTGIAGGMDHWNTPNGFLPHISILYLPCLAVWFGRRLKNSVHAVGFPAVLGLILILPGLLFFAKRLKIDDVIFIFAMTVFLPAIIALASRAIKSFLTKHSDDSNMESLRLTAKRIHLFSVLGFVLFPQLVQPAILDTALKLEAQGKDFENDEQIMRPAKMARIMSTIALGVIATAGMLSALMAMLDAFL